MPGLCDKWWKCSETENGGNLLDKKNIAPQIRDVEMEWRTLIVTL